MAGALTVRAIPPRASRTAPGPTAAAVSPMVRAAPPPRPLVGRPQIVNINMNNAHISIYDIIHVNRIVLLIVPTISNDSSSNIHGAG